MDGLDKTDLQILRILQENARLTNKEIGDKIHKSESVVSRRISDLEERKYILAYHTILNRRQLGFGLLVSTLVMLEKHRPEMTDGFEQAINQQFPNVLQWSRLQGSWDYLLTFAVRDVDHYTELHRHLMSLENVARTRAHTPQYASLPRPLPLP